MHLINVKVALHALTRRKTTGQAGGGLIARYDRSIGANAFWTVFKSIRIQGSYVGNRQDAVEALQLASEGKVKVNFELKKLKDLKE